MQGCSCISAVPLPQRCVLLPHLQVAPSDFVAIALALAATTAELQSGHSIFTLNNLVACIIATEVSSRARAGHHMASVLVLGLLASWSRCCQQGPRVASPAARHCDPGCARCAAVHTTAPLPPDTTCT